MASQAAYTKGDLGRHQTQLRRILLHVHSSSYTVVGVDPHSLRVDLTHKRANNNQVSITTKGPIKPSQGTFTEHPAQVTKETTPLASTGHLLQKATLQIQGIIADFIILIHRKKNRQPNEEDKETGRK